MLVSGVVENGLRNDVMRLKDWIAGEFSMIGKMTGAAASKNAEMNRKRRLWIMRERPAMMVGM